MNISNCPTAKKYCEFVPNFDNNGFHINDIVWEEDVTKEDISDPTSRIYILTINDEIAKIGASQDNGGIKSTLSFYKTGCKSSGTPSIRSFGIYRLIQEELNAGNKVALYLIKQPKVQAPINSLFKTNQTISINVNTKEVESFCLEEYNNYYQQLNPSINKYIPRWNFQEAHKKWPDFIREEYNLFFTKKNSPTPKPNSKTI